VPTNIHHAPWSRETPLIRSDSERLISDSEEHQQRNQEDRDE
jgi:hypothetical protein